MADEDFGNTHLGADDYRTLRWNERGAGSATAGGLVPINVGPVSLFTALAPGPFTWTTVPIACRRLLISRLTITASAVSLYAVRITSEPAGAGELMYSAAGFPDPVNAISWTWRYENHVGTQVLHIGIRNDGAVSSDFELTRLSGEKLT